MTAPNADTRRPDGPKGGEADSPFAPAVLLARDAARQRRIVLRVGTAAGVQLVAVPNAAGNVAVTFARQEPNAAYLVLATPSWNTTVWITNQTATGCTVNFGTAAPGAQRCALMIVREG